MSNAFDADPTGSFRRKFAAMLMAEAAAKRQIKPSTALGMHLQGADGLLARGLLEYDALQERKGEAKGWQTLADYLMPQPEINTTPPASSAPLPMTTEEPGAASAMPVPVTSMPLPEGPPMPPPGASFDERFAPVAGGLSPLPGPPPQAGPAQFDPRRMSEQPDQIIPNRGSFADRFAPALPTSQPMPTTPPMPPAPNGFNPPDDAVWPLPPVGGWGAPAPVPPAAPAPTAGGAAPGGSPYAAAIASVESPGHRDPYTAMGPVTRSGDRAYGKYQVMGNNIPSWTREVLGTEMSPQQFLSDKRAQDAVFEGKFGQYVEKYGNPQDAASVWFTGKPLAEGASRSDRIPGVYGGMTGQQYVDRFTNALALQSPQAMAPGGRQQTDTPVTAPTGGPLANTRPSGNPGDDPVVTAQAAQAQASGAPRPPMQIGPPGFGGAAPAPQGQLPPGVTPERIRGFLSDPNVPGHLKAALIQQLQPQRSFVKIGVDPQTGEDMYGFVDGRTGRVVPYRVPPGAQTGAPPPSGASIPAPPPGANAKKWRETYTEQVAKGLAPGPPPTGFEFVNPANPGAGIRATPGGPATHVPADLAARVAAMDVAVADLPKAREVLQRQWSIQEKAHAAAGVGKIGEAQRAVRFAVEAALRAMSGAGVPDSEVTRYAQIFTPGQTDSVETARSKLDMLDRFLQGARSNAMQGRQSDPGAGGAPPSAPRVRRYNPQTGGLE